MFALVVAVHAAEVPVLTVCEALNNRIAYNGKTIVIIGRIVETMEGGWLTQQCSSPLIVDGYQWDSSISLSWRVGKTAPRPALPAEYRLNRSKVRAKLPELKKAGVKFAADCDCRPGWAAIYGRFESREKFAIGQLTNGRMAFGFGHLATSPAQLVSPDNGTWCWIQHPIQPGACSVKPTPREVQAALWSNLKEALIDPAPGPECGRPYFEANMRGTLLPRLTGTLISSDPPERPTVLLAALSDPTTPEVRLVLNRPLNKPVAPGTAVEFEGVAVALSLDPFLVTFEVARARLIIRPQ